MESAKGSKRESKRKRSHSKSTGKTKTKTKRSKKSKEVETPQSSLQPPSTSTSTSSSLTVAQISEDVLTQLALKFWASGSSEEGVSYNAKLIEDVYETEIVGTNHALKRIVLLELSQYLENYLWPNFDAVSSTKAHLMSIAVLVNEKFREGVSAWESFIGRPEQFPGFFQRILSACVDEDDDFSFKEHSILMLFLVNCFKSLEVDIIREQIQRLVSLSIWTNLLPSRLEQELKSDTKLKKYWSALKKRDAKADEKTRAKQGKERKFLWNLIQKFLGVVMSIPESGAIDEEKLNYCNRFVELLIDLESMLPTRRFFNTLLDDSHLVIKCRMSPLSRRVEGKLFNQLLDILKFYTGFEINDRTGLALTDHDMTDIHYNSITSLQRAAFVHFKELETFALSTVASVDPRPALRKHFGALPARTLHKIAAHLNLLPEPEPMSDEDEYDKEFILEMLVSRHEKRLSQIEALNEMPIYPTDEILWDENVVPSEYYSGDGCLALPKLNLQFLTLHDYLLRNLNLFRLESTYEIRQDIEDVVKRMKPWTMNDGSTGFKGWARMAQPIAKFAVVEVAKPNIGENRPSRVRADVTLTLGVRPEIKEEWQALRRRDVLFLITCRMPSSRDADQDGSFKEKYGIAYVRGCEVEGMLNQEGKLIEDNPFEDRPEVPGDKRTFRIRLDTNQYQQDMAATLKGAEDVYETFNILMRRKPKENNFKAILETIRELMNTDCVVPDWIHDVFLGYGSPDASHYSKLPAYIPTLDWNDTFLSIDHLRACFPGHDVKCSVDDPVPPFRLTIPRVKDASKPELIVESYQLTNRGPYPYDQPRRNAIPFTPTQIEAIKSGMQPGLTLVVGPPGTGKTDVAVQIISNIYHNFPNQRTLIVTHSNQALNQLFEKILALDIEERHLLRLGHGEEDLLTEKDFSRYGRVNFILGKRLELLEEVQRLQVSLGVPGDVAYTCETSTHFFTYQVLGRWEKFVHKLKQNKDEDVGVIAKEFPFKKFFENAPQPLFKGVSYEEDFDIAKGCFTHIKTMFTQIDAFRAFELLRRGQDRTNYMLVKEAKIIAMTCTHAALKRHELVRLGFTYDNVLMEESAQVLEVETFIPLMLQKPEDGVSRLKRVILIGDHHQLPPVVQNMAFQKFSNMEQSLFTRFVRLGVPTVQLDAQGRSRPSLCQLYGWRYRALGNLPHVYRWPEFMTANAGFFFDYQLINVEDFKGVGESQPNPHFYQNLAEAEYVVAVYMFMRLQGYPAEKISILTTYNGQKHLIRDIISKRCSKNPCFGFPSRVSTVDRFQGQQNDYVLLSLVRTKAVGHIRDVRRLIVAMSRARLGLYVFARASLFQNCYELSPVFSLLLQRPLQLHLAPDEMYPTQRESDVELTCQPFVVGDMSHMANYVHQLYYKRIGDRQSTQISPPPEEQQTGTATSKPSQEEEEKEEGAEKASRDDDENDVSAPAAENDEDEEE
ncbi:RNA helicase aquarius-like [Oscarella lobularis]|uniref:RNA helicase aquarius-like n=1 Tax=Oscarella lobularis TaxID=121494 RepID=UPI003313F72E